jgi:hypothetical protein
MLAEPVARHHEVVAEAELNVDYGGSPIVMGDANSRLGPGQRVPDTIAIHSKTTDARPGRLHELTHRAGHTLVLLGGTTANRAELADLLGHLQQRVAGSAVFDAAVALGAGPDLPDGIASCDPVAADPVAADLVGVDGVTLLAVRPDGYVGLRADRDHLAALERYERLIRGSRATPL